MSTTTTPAAGFVVATAFRGHDEWELRSGHASRPSAAEMSQLRHAYGSRGLRVRVFSEADWDALPYGQQSSDWVDFSDGTRCWRWEDGVRQW